MDDQLIFASLSHTGMLKVPAFYRSTNTSKTKLKEVILPPLRSRGVFIVGFPPTRPGGFLPHIILLTLFYYHRGIRLNAMMRGYVSCQSMFQPKRFDKLSPCLGDAHKV